MTTNLGRLGVWSMIDHLSAGEAVALARQIERWGYTALWIPEAMGRDPFALIGYLAAQTETLVFATGIANIYARDPMLMKSIRKTLAGIAPGRFVLGLGVSHTPFVEGMRGHAYEKPLEKMRAYLDAMDAASYQGPEPDEEAPIVLGALRSKMLSLAAERTRGAHPYLVPPEHTKRARERMGPAAWLCPEQMVCLETDPGRARAIARENLAIYMELANYRNNLRELGFEDADFENSGSDRLVDAIVAWGDESAIAARIEAHIDAGASHVCVQAFRTDGRPGPDQRLLEALSPGR